MQFFKDSKFIANTLSGIIIAICAISFYFIVKGWDTVNHAFDTLTSILTPITIGVVIAYLLNPILNFFEKQIFLPLIRKIKKNPDIMVNKYARGLSIVCTLIVFFAALTGFLWLIIPQIYVSVRSIAQSMPAYYAELQNRIYKWIEDYPQVADTVTNLSNTAYIKVQDWLNKDIIPNLGNIVLSLSNGVIGSISFLFDIIVGLIVAVYVMADKTIFKAQMKKILYALLGEKKANACMNGARYADKTFGGFINGKIIDSIIIGIICFIVLSILHIDYSLLISVIIGVTNIVPFFGPFIGAVPCGLLLLLVDPFQCLIFIIVIIILQIFDGNILGPIILGDSTGLSSFWVMFAILVFGGVFGVKGMIIGVPAFACIYMLLKLVITKLLEKRNLPADTTTYKTLYQIDPETGRQISVKEHEIYLREKKREKREKKKLGHKVKDALAEKQIESMMPSKEDDASDEKTDEN